MSKLKPCPFCWREGVRWVSGSAHYIYCDCGVEVFFGTSAEAIAAWNRRADRALRERDEARAEAEKLREALRDVLALEAEKASNKGDCCCMFWDRTREREYETGTCPHQRARAALNTTRND